MRLNANKMKMLVFMSWLVKSHQSLLEVGEKEIPDEEDSDIQYNNLYLCCKSHLENEVYGNAEVSGNAWVSGKARVYGKAQVYGDAEVYGNARVFGNAEVYGNARVSGDARVSGKAWVSEEYSIMDDVVEYWKAEKRRNK